MENKKWFASKKFWTPILAAAVVALNSAFDWSIPQDQILIVFVPVIIYLIGEFFLDAKGKQKSPLEDPKVRDAIEALASDLYDYTVARDAGIDQHAAEVKEKVMAGLETILDPDFRKHAKEIGGEVLRYVLKMYREDSKIEEGAAIVKEHFKKGDLNGS